MAKPPILPTKNMKNIKNSFTLLLVILPAITSAFLPGYTYIQHPNTRPPFSQHSQHPKSILHSTSIPLDESSSSSFLPFHSTIATHFDPSQCLLSHIQTTENIDIHPSIHEEFLDIISHLFDLMTFLFPEATSCPFFEVINRVLELAGHFSDGSLPPEEAMFQVAMLGLSSKAFVKSVSPFLLAFFASASFRDHRAYEILFGATGLSWIEFKTMFVNAVDWVEVEPDTFVDTLEEEEEYIYWLYQGDIDVTLDGATVYHVASEPDTPNFHDMHGIGLLGEMEFAHKLERTQMGGGGRQHRQQINTSSTKTLDFYKRTVTKTGDKGATLLRINTSKLLELMEADHHLADAMYSLLFNGMQEKLSILMERAVVDLDFGSKNGSQMHNKPLPA